MSRTSLVASRAPWNALEGVRAATWLVTGLTVLAAGLRGAGLGESLFGDELFLWAIVDDRSLGQVLSEVHDTEKTPPLGFLLSWLCARLGEAPELIRLPSFLAGIATVPLVYLVGARTVGRAAGVVAAAWFALDPFEIFYGTEARSYALVSAFVVLSTLALLRAIEGHRRLWWGIYALATAAAVHSHYIAALVLIPQAAWALWRHRDSAREQLVAGGLAALALLAWLPSFIVQARNSADEARRISEMVPFTLSNVAEFAVKPLVAHPYIALSELPGTVPLIVIVACLAGALAAVGQRTGRPRGDLAQIVSSRAGLLALLALAPPVGLILYSLRPETSFLLPRNLAIAVPYALLLVGALLTAPGRRVATALSLAALAALGVGTVKMLDPARQRPDARGAAGFIDARAPTSAPVVDVPGPHAIRTYLDPRRPVRTVGEFGPDAWAEAARTRSRVFFTFPDIPGLGRTLTPPPEYAGRFVLVARHSARGVPYEIGVREYARRPVEP